MAPTAVTYGLEAALVDMLKHFGGRGCLEKLCATSSLQQNRL